MLGMNRDEKRALQLLRQSGGSGRQSVGIKWWASSIRTQCGLAVSARSLPSSEKISANRRGRSSSWTPSKLTTMFSFGSRSSSIASFNAGFMFGVANRHGAVEFGVIAFRVDDAKLKSPVGEAFKQAHCNRGFTAAGAGRQSNSSLPPAAPRSAMRTCRIAVGFSLSRISPRKSWRRCAKWLRERAAPRRAPSASYQGPPFLPGGSSKALEQWTGFRANYKRKELSAGQATFLSS